MMTLPNFIIIGAYKSGTTSLYHYLRQHPQIFMSPIKEPHFFAHEIMAEMMRSAGRKPTVIDTIEAYTALFSGVTAEKAIGEASPSYLGAPNAAKCIKEILPDVKLIAILRHPVDAFYSDHNMRIRDRRISGNGFEERFRDLVSRIRAGEIAGPMYYQQLKTYYDFFDPSRLKVFLYEDLVTDPKALTQDVFGFIDVDATFVPNTSERHNIGRLPRSHYLDDLLRKILRKRTTRELSSVRNLILSIQRLNTVRSRPISPELRREFMAVFEEDSEKLEKLIDRDLSGWRN
jgi:sulfotransferase family protein